MADNNAATESHDYQAMYQTLKSGSDINKFTSDDYLSCSTHSCCSSMFSSSKDVADCNKLFANGALQSALSNTDNNTTPATNTSEKPFIYIAPIKLKSTDEQSSALTENNETQNNSTEKNAENTDSAQDVTVPVINNKESSTYVAPIGAAPTNKKQSTDDKKNSTKQKNNIWF